MKEKYNKTNTSITDMTFINININIIIIIIIITCTILSLIILMIVSIINNKKHPIKIDHFRTSNITSNAILTPGKKVNYKKIISIIINSISIMPSSSLTQPDEVLVIFLKITNEAGAEIYLNQLYEDADYNIISNSVSFINDPLGFGTLTQKILDGINSEPRYANFEFIFSKYKIGYPRTRHDFIDFSMNMDIVHEISIFDYLEDERRG